MKQQIKTTEAIFPMPVLLISTFNEDGTVDAIVPDGFVSYPAARTGAANERVNLRGEASSDADVLCVLNKNTALAVLGEQGSYYQVKYGDRLGFVAREYVTLGASGEPYDPETDPVRYRRVDGELVPLTLKMAMPDSSMPGMAPRISQLSSVKS